MNSTLKLTPIRLAILFCLGLVLGFLCERPGKQTVQTSAAKRAQREQRRDDIVASGELKEARRDS